MGLKVLNGYFFFSFSRSSPQHLLHHFLTEKAIILKCILRPPKRPQSLPPAGQETHFSKGGLGRLGQGRGSQSPIYHVVGQGRGSQSPIYHVVAFTHTENLTQLHCGSGPVSGCTPEVFRYVYRKLIWKSYRPI